MSCLLHFITAFNGKLLSKKKWSDIIGNMLPTVTKFAISPSFVRLSFSETFVPLRDSVDKGLSAHEGYG